MADLNECQFEALQKQLNRIENILMGAQPEPEQVGSDFIFDNIIRDVAQLKEDVKILKRMFVTPPD